jgi:hypothetical protein
VGEKSFRIDPWLVASPWRRTAATASSCDANFWPTTIKSGHKSDIAVSKTDPSTGFLSASESPDEIKSRINFRDSLGSALLVAEGQELLRNVLSEMKKELTRLFALAFPGVGLKAKHHDCFIPDQASVL